MEYMFLPQWVLGLSAFFFGLLWGSFANVCIFRIPDGISIFWPPSRCPVCFNEIKPVENIPVISWIFLRARCRRCGSGISFRYPLVELSVAVLSLAVALNSPNFFSYISWFFFSLALVVVSFTDMDCWLIPDTITYPGLLAGVVISFFRPTTPAGFQVTTNESLIGLAMGGGFLFIVGYIYKIFSGKIGMGDGDVKLMAVVGAFLGYKAVFPIIFLSALQGCIAGFVMIVVRKRFKGRGKNETLQADHDDFVPTGHHMPYGPFISLGAMECMFYGNFLPF